ncbi:hypothetical protein [Aeoliella sp.]|uniref:hypothetical protein n=1 Tax=Aeoliella sp. TaxID=2795800 RepID=UPI003CCC1A42
MRFTVRSILVLTTGVALWLALLVHAPQVAVVLAAIGIAVAIFWSARFVRPDRMRDAMFVLGVLWSYFTSYLLAIAIWPRQPPEVVEAIYVLSFDWLNRTPVRHFLEWYFEVCQGVR